MDISENLQRINRRIELACERSQREPSEVQLIAVSKTHSPDVIEQASKAGQTCFGENKVQEAKLKIPQCPGHLHWHFIGHLQTNKVRDVVLLFEMVQSVDSLKLAEELNKRCDQASRDMPILLEVNVAGESSKFGYSPERLLDELEALNSLPRLAIHGLMCIPPYSSLAEKSRPYFQQLQAIRQRCEERLGVPLPHLSMGMSGDFEVAIEEGATMVRLGTALFGERARSKSN